MNKALRIILIYIPVGLVLTSVLLVTVLRWCPVWFTPLMLERGIQSIGDKSMAFERKWTPIEEISDNIIAAVIASEDQKFLSHRGFDFEELSKMKSLHEKKGKPIRGCSTISQQTAKNCFTWCTHTYIRKAVEGYFTFLIECIWGKKRIIEVYLNVAEMGPGIYGAEAASLHYFHVHASKTSLSDAASLVCCLPNPRRRTPSWAVRHMPRSRAKIVYDVRNNIDISPLVR